MLPMIFLAVLGSGDLPDQSQLTDDFNKAKGKVRVVMLVSPTCKVCVHGVNVIRDDVVLKLKDRRLVTFSVFIPMIDGDSKAPAVASGQALSKHGIKSYWDGQKKLGTAFAKAMKAPKELPIVWDTYLVYGPDAVWGKTPPKPSFYMHQLKENDPLFLDGKKFRAEIERELKKMKPNNKLVFLTRDGCANTAVMRKNLDAAIAKVGSLLPYDVVNLDDLPAGDVRKGYPTPTILLDNVDPFGMREPKLGSQSVG